MVNPELVEEVKRSMYMDDWISGGETRKQAVEIKMTATKIFGQTTSELQKWESNNLDLDVETMTSDEESQSYAKQQLGTLNGKKTRTKLRSTLRPQRLIWQKGTSNEKSQHFKIHSD